jgi:hypothetical protein
MAHSWDFVGPPAMRVCAELAGKPTTDGVATALLKVFVFVFYKLQWRFDQAR